MATGQGSAVGTSAWLDSKVISGRLRQLIQKTLGSVSWVVVALESFGTQTINVTVIQFVAFGIKNACLWGLDPLILCPFDPFVLTLVFTAFHTAERGGVR